MSNEQLAFMNLREAARAYLDFLRTEDGSTALRVVLYRNTKSPEVYGITSFEVGDARAAQAIPLPKHTAV